MNIIDWFFNLFLPKETKNLIKINEIARGIDFLVRDRVLDKDSKIYELMEFRIQLLAIDTKEHHYKIEHWVFFIDALIDKLQK